MFWRVLPSTWNQRTRWLTYEYRDHSTALACSCALVLVASLALRRTLLHRSPSTLAGPVVARLKSNSSRRRLGSSTVSSAASAVVQT